MRPMKAGARATVTSAAAVQSAWRTTAFGVLIVATVALGILLISDVALLVTALVS